MPAREQSKLVPQPQPQPLADSTNQITAISHDYSPNIEDLIAIDPADDPTIPSVSEDPKTSSDPAKTSSSNSPSPSPPSSDNTSPPKPDHLSSDPVEAKNPEAKDQGSSREKPESKFVSFSEPLTTEYQGDKALSDSETSDTDATPKPLSVDDALDSLEVRGAPNPNVAHLRVLNRTPHGIAEIYADTCAPMNIMSHDFRNKYYPDHATQRLTEPLHIGGMGGKGPLVTQMVIVPITLLDTDKRPWQRDAKVFLVDELKPGCILGVEFLRSHQLNIKWGSESQNDQLFIGSTGRAIWATSLPVNKPKLHKHKTYTVRAATDCLIEPGEGMTVPVQHPHLPLRTEGYLISPHTIKDPTFTTLGSLLHGICDGQDTGLPFANLGTAPIKLRKGDKLATVQANQIDSSPEVWASHAQTKAPHAISLADILGVEEEEEDEEPEDRYGDGYPFHLPDPPPQSQAPITPIDMSKVDVPQDWPPEVLAKLEYILNKSARLFRNELGRFNDGIQMPIKFKEDANLEDLHQRPYRQSRKDRKAMDSILDPLRDCGVVEKIPLGQPVPIASPAFLVWKKLKPRVVVDLRKVNMRMIGDAYPLPRQDDILGALHGSTVFTVVDVMKGFFQQEIPREDRWKTAFVTAHRGHEQFTVATMGLKTSPSFFQHRMERLFEGYLWKFVLVYIDDVIIFSKNIDEHLEHLDVVFSILAASGCTMSLEKCHFAQHGLEALGVHVSRLGLATTEEKVAAIRQLEMPRTLHDLEQALGLMGFQRNWIYHFAAISAPLQELKTFGFRDCKAKANPARRQYAQRYSLPPVIKAPIPNDKGKITEKEQQTYKKATEDMAILWDRAVRAWDILKKRLCEAVELAHPDYTKPFILRVDSSRGGVGGGLYQIQEDGKLRPVLFLSRLLSPTESRYGICEVETCGLVWTLKKLMHILDHGEVYVYTDHNAIAQSFIDADGRPKVSDRLRTWRLFLSRFAHRLKIIHVPGKTLVDADALSRLPRQRPDQPHAAVEAFVVTRAQAGKVALRQPPQESPEPSERQGPTALPVPTDEKEPQSQAEVRIADVDGVVVASLHISETMKEEFVAAYEKDKSLKTVYRRLTEQLDHPGEMPTLTFHLFRIDPETRLMYFMDPSGDRLAVPFSQRQAILRMAHDNRAHQGIQRTYEYLRTIAFFQKMKAYVTEYIREACPECSATKLSSQRPYGDLLPIETPIIPISILCLDFIVGLPVSKKGNDAILIIVDKTSKFVKTIIGETTHTAEDWAELYLHRVYADWGLPDAFVSDMDKKFVSGLWTALCKAASIDMKVSAAYHHSANGQAERTVQTFINSMVTLLGAKLNPDNWEDYVPHVTHCLNTSTSATTSKSPYEILYGRKAKTFLPIDHTLGENFALAQQTLRQEAADTTALAQARMKLYYDSLHRNLPTLAEGDMVYVRLSKPGHPGYHLNNQTKLSFRKVGPFPVEKVINPRRYRIMLPPWLKWEKDMSIENLIPAHTDKFARPLPEPGGITQDGTEKYIVENIEDHAKMRKPGDDTTRIYYKVKWMGYDDRTWEPLATLREDVPKLLDAYHARTKTARCYLTTLPSLDHFLPNMGF
ncbi:hypothetical protein GQX73_g10196 [Xylaria multiplex]|uniref:RNA-directed DNA polymerase n=1 Tax=Xylaria multiplex TaxID=323545 RepID=A0A7C8IGX1_9PEZI|nr:hypothetical protein GQX73_g10196 [Xylaria multiplex]